MPPTATTTGTVVDGRRSPTLRAAAEAARATSTPAPAVGNKGSTPSVPPDNSSGTWYAASHAGPEAASTPHTVNSARGATAMTTVSTVTTTA